MRGMKMAYEGMEQFLKDRHNALMAFIMRDDWDAIYAYCEKYGAKLPSNERIARGSIYKAALDCTDIPEKVKKIARQKLVAIGLKPIGALERIAMERRRMMS